MMLIDLVILELVPRTQPLGLLPLGPRDKLEDDYLCATSADGFVRQIPPLSPSMTSPPQGGESRCWHDL